MSKIRVVQRFTAQEVLDMGYSKLMLHIHHLCCYLTGKTTNSTRRAVTLRRDFGMSELEVEELVLLLGSYFSTDISLYDPDAFADIHDVYDLVHHSAEQAICPANPFKARQKHWVRYNELDAMYSSPNYVHEHDRV